MKISENEPVSIILPTYNRAEKIGKAIESVLGQTYPHFELLVVDDGSTDDTERVIKTYQEKDARIRYQRLQENMGQSRARNIGMQMARYSYFAFEDSDDLWRKQKLERQMAAMREADDTVGLIYHKIRYDMGAGYHCILPDEKIADEKKQGDIYAQLLRDNLIGMPSALVKKECVQEVGGIDESFRCLEDYDFALRIAKRYAVVFLNEIYLDSEFSNTGVSGKSYEYLIASCKLLQKYKADYLATNTFNHRVEIILRDAGRLGITEQIVQLMEKMLQI